jgi:Protein of unknown function (DUF1559)
LAVANYHDSDGHYPPPFRTDEGGHPLQSWRILVLPYIEQHELYKAVHPSESWDGPNNGQLAGRMPKLFALHGDYKPGMTTANYLPVVGPNTAWRPGRPVTQKDVKDGSSNTILIPENRGMNVPWMEPRDLDFATMDWSINSPRGMSSKYDAPAAVFLDGSVRRLGPTIVPDVLRALCTIDGGEPVSENGGHWELLTDGRNRPVADP